MDIVDKLLADQPSFHQHGAARWDSLPETLRLIQRSVHPGSRTLETGVGASTVVFAAGGAVHTAISPDAEEHRRVRAYCNEIGVDDSKLDLIVGLSDDVLPSMGNARIFDMIFLDGAHSFPYPEVDWHYATRMLKVGGRMLIDDVPIPAVHPLFRHMSVEPNWDLDGTFDNRSAAFSLSAPPAPEEWSSQPFNRGYPDYSFVPLLQRAPLVVKAEASRLRRSAARRFPGLRDRWRNVRGSVSADE